MPNLYDTEVWDSENENLLQSFTGSDALCDATEHAKYIGSECLIYHYDGSEWLRWSGPRPVNPPGR
jgi:hypothetical protein